MTDQLRKFDHRIEHPEPHVVALLSAIDEARGLFRVCLRMTPHAITSLRKSVLVTSTGASTRIEGSMLSDREVQKIMQDLSQRKIADRDTQEVQGYLETLQNVFESYETLPLTEGIVTMLHRELLKYSTKDDLHRGTYKRKENLVGVLSEEGNIAQVMFDTTPAWLTQKEMTELVEWTQHTLEGKRFHPLLVVANFVVEFLKIHPFEDGNGRLSRVLTNLLLLRTGYAFAQYASHERIVERRKDEYYLALRTSQHTFGTSGEYIAPWLNFFLSVVKEQANEALALVAGDLDVDTLSPKQHQVLQYFEAVTDAGPLEISEATGVAMPTVRIKPWTGWCRWASSSASAGDGPPAT